MPYYVAIRAYGVGDNADSNVTESSPPELGTPNNLYAILDGTDVDVEWDYAYVSGDDLQGFRVYIGYNPIPQWGDATDTGLSGGDGGSPTATFSVNIPNIWYGDVYVCVEARGAGTQTYSTVIPLMLPPKPVYDVQIDGVADETLRWASDLRVTTRATEDPACDLRGVPIPTVTDFVAGANVTVNVTGRTVEISATGGGGGAVDSVNGQTGVVVLDHDDVGAAASSHTHDADDIVSGELDDARLPVVPTTKGGTGLTTIGSAGYVLTVNGTGDALGWEPVATGSPTWGSISGLLSNQTDLQNALDSKEGTVTAGTTAQYWRGDKSWQTLNKAAVGLGNVDNTSDANKPISSATQSALDDKADTSSLGTAAFEDVPTSGNATSGQVVMGDDTRLSDARTPTAHTHPLSQITDAGTAAGFDVPASGNASSSEVVLGDDSRLSDARTPTSHTHAAGDIVSGTLSDARLPTVPVSKGGTGLTVIGSSGYYLAVNSGGTALEWAPPPSVDWGEITGTLSDQADLQIELNAKGNLTGGNSWNGNQTLSTGDLNIASGNLSVVGIVEVDGVANFYDDVNIDQSLAVEGDVTATSFDGSGAGLTDLDADNISAGTLNEARLPNNINATRIANGTVDNTEFQYLNGVTSAIQTQLNNKQTLDSDLTALANNGTNGLWARTGTGTGAARTITAGTGISLTNGNGVSGNPTIAINAAVVPQWGIYNSVSGNNTVPTNVSFLSINLNVGSNVMILPTATAPVGKEYWASVINLDGAGTNTLTWDAGGGFNIHAPGVFSQTYALNGAQSNTVHRWFKIVKIASTVWSIDTGVPA